MDTGRFQGHPGRECGEHRTTGSRAWCHDCSEWCYPGDGGCKGCELPGLRARAAELEAVEKRVRALLASCDYNERHIRANVPHLPPCGGTFSVHAIREILKVDHRCGGEGCPIR
jgi:hypothetical protein